MAVGAGAAGTLVVEGLAELKVALRAVDESLVDIIAVANRKVAVLVAETGKAAASTPLERRAADTLRPGTQGSASTVRLGNAQTPGALGAEFGSRHDVLRPVKRGGHGLQVRGWNQFKPWRGTGEGAGYFLWPAIRRDAPQILAVHHAEIQRLLDRYFPIHGPTFPT